MNQCPLLLKYKIRECYKGQETDFDPGNDVLFKDCTTCEKQNLGKIWRLQSPYSGGFIKLWDDVILFLRYEVHVAGNADPIMIWFDRTGGRFDIECIRTFQLSNDYESGNFHSNWEDQKNLQINPILLEYERHRGDWETRVIVNEL